MKEIIAEEAWLYHTWGGTFKIYFGTVYASVYENDTLFASFKTTFGKRIGCSVKEKIVHNNVVWLSEKNDELAAEILIEDVKNKILIHRDKIENLEAKIKLLEGEMMK